MTDNIEVSYRETECKPTGHYIGLDLGQAADFSALVVNERSEGKLITLKRKSWQPEPIEAGSRPLIKHRIRFIHRYALGTSYPDIVTSVGRIMNQLPLMRDRPELWVDGTGVGRAVVDVFREHRLNPIAVTITGGSASHRVSQHDVRIPKRELASLMQAVLQTGRIEIARDLVHAGTLQSELANFRVKLSVAGAETFEGRSGVHDDLVLGLAIAVWAAENRNSGPGLAMLEIARREMEGLHGKDAPEPVKPSFQPGSVEYASEQAAKGR